MAHNLKLLFLKNNNGANDFLVKIYLHFTQKYYTVPDKFTQGNIAYYTTHHDNCKYLLYSLEYLAKDHPDLLLPSLLFSHFSLFER